MRRDELIDKLREIAALPTVSFVDALVIHIAASTLAAEAWHPMSDTPIPKGRLLVACADKDCCTEIYDVDYDGETYTAEVVDGFETIDTDFITHWRVFPKDPEERG